MTGTVETGGGADAAPELLPRRRRSEPRPDAEGPRLLPEAPGRKERLAAPMLLPLEPTPDLVRAHATTDASELAQYMAEGVRQGEELSVEEVADLMEMLLHLVAQRENSTATLRLGHLRLLIELVEVTTTGFIRRSAYEEARATTPHGSGYPDASTLATYYGGWLKAVHAAVDWLTHGGRARIKVDKKACRMKAAYNVQEIRAAILRCRLDIGDWPNEWEWEEWASLERILSDTDPRLPTIKALRKAYDSFDDAVDDTRRAFERSAAAQSLGVSAPRHR
jgi:hypothetical protein